MTFLSGWTTVASVDAEKNVSEHLCGAFQFPTSQPFRNDKSRLNRKQIAPNFQIIISCDVREKNKSSPKLSLLCCVSLCFAFSVPKPQQLWEISPSCHHFDLIVESVNQAAARWANLILVTRYFGSHRALC